MTYFVIILLVIINIITLYKYFDLKNKYLQSKYLLESVSNKFKEIENYFCNEICTPQGCGEFSLNCIKQFFKKSDKSVWVLLEL